MYPNNTNKQNKQTKQTKQTILYEFKLSKMRDFYEKFFKDLLTYNKWSLKWDDEELVVFNNAWNVVAEWEASDVVKFLYEQRDFKLIRDNQRLKFWTPAWQRKPKYEKEWKIVLERHPIKMGVPLSECIED